MRRWVPLAVLLDLVVGNLSCDFEANGLVNLSKLCFENDFFIVTEVAEFSLHGARADTERLDCFELDPADRMFLATALLNVYFYARLLLIIMGAPTCSYCNCSGAISSTIISSSTSGQAGPQLNERSVLLPLKAGYRLSSSTSIVFAIVGWIDLR